MIIKKLIFSVGMFLSFVSIGNAQPWNLPLGNTMSNRISAFYAGECESVNTGFKPIIEKNDNQKLDTALYQLKRKDKFFEGHKNTWIARAAFFDNFVSIKKEGFSLYVNPLMYVEAGQLSDSAHRFILNTRGIELKGSVGEKLAFYSSFRENFSEFRPYISDWAEQRLAAPGQGAIKSYNAGDPHLDFSMSTAYLSYKPIDFLNLQVGYGKHFVGEGYRSILLSDNSFNYPYLILEFTQGGLQYSSVFAEFQDFSDVYYFPHVKKHFAVNYLSYNYNNRVELGLFEGIIYQTNDTAYYHNKFTADYFVPVIGVGTAAQYNSERHNVLTGINLKVKVTRSSILYGQIGFDIDNDTQTAWQIGAKIFDAFHGKLGNHKLYLQLEYNKAGESTYTHDSIPYQSWTHYNQELAHPLGTDFDELILIGRYSYRNFAFEYKLTNAETHPFYSNIYRTSDMIYPMVVLPPDKISNSVITGSWTVNPRTDLQLYGGIHTRTYNGDKEPFYFVGVRTGVSNFYYDF